MNTIINNIPCGADGTPSEEDANNRKTTKDSPLDRMERDYGYEQTEDADELKQWCSGAVIGDDAGLLVRFQRVLTIRKTVVGRECWTAMLYVDRDPKFSLQVFGGLSRAKAVAFDAVLAWHRNAKTGKLTGAKECAKGVL